MKLVERVGRKDLVKCEHCQSELLIEVGDLQWTHCEEDYYYVICPVCGEKVWIKSNEFFDNMWKEQIKSEK